ncbi:MAG: polyketide cyclase [Rikenellaceae bacterium]|nr:polyketide cyclase [Rikenellaceae bacterium]
MEKYESHQRQILKPAEVIYATLADFNNLTPAIADRVEDWRVEGDTCSLKVKGFAVSLRMVEKVPARLIKIEASDSSPLGFTLWIQLKEVAPADTRIRMVLHAEMPTMIKMMIGKKLEPALNNFVDQLANSFNAI